MKTIEMLQIMLALIFVACQVYGIFTVFKQQFIFLYFRGLKIETEIFPAATDSRYFREVWTH